MRPKIIIDDKIPFIHGAFEDVADVEYISGALISKNDLKDANALITRTRTKCNELILKDSQIQIIASATIGFDHIDTQYCESHNIKWTNAPGCNSGSVLQYVLSAIFAWERKYNFAMKNKTIGIVGVGNVGSKIAKAAKALGMNVLLNDPPREDLEKSGNFCSFDEIIENADIITFHTPLNKTGKYCSFHLANELFFQKIVQRDKDICLINSSRGSIVDNKALKETLMTNEKIHASMDVWENEPNIDLELLKLCDFATSHIAGYSADGKANGTKTAVQNVSDCLNLGLEKWQPVKPETESVLKVNSNKDIIEILKEFHDFAYSIEKDSNILKSNPKLFEKHRGEYQLRRELFTYPILSDKSNKLAKLKEIISKISF